MKLMQLTLGFRTDDFTVKTKIKKISLLRFFILIFMDVAILLASCYLGASQLNLDDFPRFSFVFLVVFFAGNLMPMIIFVAIMLVLAKQVYKESKEAEQQEESGYPLPTQ